VPTVPCDGELDIDRRQRLSNLIVKFPRDGPALILRPYEPSRQVPEFLPVSSDLGVVFANGGLEPAHVPR
jgi:hypothetical protein